MVNRYREMIDQIPIGSFWGIQSRGEHILPVLSVDQEFLFETDAASTDFGVFVDDHYEGIVTTDANGNVRVSAALASGKHSVAIENDITAQRYTSWIDVREFAVWLNAYAQAFEGVHNATTDQYGLDESIVSVFRGLRLQDVDDYHINDAFGRPLRQTNGFDLDLNSYRRLLQNLRQAYRLWSARPAGLRQTIGGVTSILPKVIPDRWRPQWFLGQQLLPNSNLQVHSATIDPATGADWDPLPNINDVALDYIAASFTDAAGSKTIANQPPSPQTIFIATTSWTTAANTLTVTGTAVGGGVISEVFTPTTSPSTEVLLGAEVFETITSIVATGTGATGGTATVGLGESRFVTIREPQQDLHIAFGSGIGLTYRDDADGEGALIWGATTAIARHRPVKVPTSGTYTLERHPGQALFVGLAQNSTAAAAEFDFGTPDPLKDRLYLEFGERGILEVDVSTATSVNDVVTAISAALVADPRYTTNVAAAHVGTGSYTSAAVSLVPNVGDYELANQETRIRIHPGPADAALQALGLPRHTGTTAGSTAAFSSSMTTTGAFNINTSTDSSVPVYIGRGLFTTGTNTGAIENASTSTAEFVDSSVDFYEHYDYVQSTFASNAAPLVGPFTDPPFPQKLVVTFRSDWDAGSHVTLEGTLASGTVVSEIITSAPDESIVTANEFATVTDITFVAGTGGDSCEVGLALTRDFPGGRIRILNGASDNDGLHTIAKIIHKNRVLLKHETARLYTGSPATILDFTNEAAGTLDWQLWSPGEIVEVSDKSGTTLTIDSPGNLFTWPATTIEDANEMPFVVDSAHQDRGKIIVDVDTTLAPSIPATYTDSVTFDGHETPDGWLINNSTSIAIGSVSYAYFNRSRVIIQRAAGVGVDIQFEAEVSRVVPDLRGFPMRAQFWVQQHNKEAAETFTIYTQTDGSTWVQRDAAIGVFGTPLVTGTGASPLDPTLVSADFSVPVDATNFRIRLEHTGVANTDYISIERAVLVSLYGASHFLGSVTGTGFSPSTTIPRSAHRDHFGEVVYVWSPDDTHIRTGLTQGELDRRAAERLSIGLPVSGSSDSSLSPPAGHVDWVTNAHGLWERFDVSEYTATIPTFRDNFIGAWDASTWNSATLENLDLVFGVPSRMSYLEPSVISAVAAEVLVPDFSGVATLADNTTHDGPYNEDPNGSTVLYVDGVPIPDSANAAGTKPYVFTAANIIDIDASEYSSSSEYTLDYQRRVRATTEVLDFGSDASSYLWLTDAMVYRRAELTVSGVTVTHPVRFGGDNIATLPEPSDKDRRTSTLRQDNARDITDVLASRWSYLDQNRIRIDRNTFDTDSLYTLEYEAQVNTFERAVTMEIEHRSSDTEAGVLAATWVTVEVDDPLLIEEADGVSADRRHHQFRITLTGVGALTDVRVFSLGARGINLAGTGYAPGIIVTS